MKLFSIQTCSLSTMLVFACTVFVEGQVETPAQADKFVDSIGVNVHLGYTNTLYSSNFPLVQEALVNLGIRHVRDSAPLAAPPGFYSNHSALLASGIHGEFGVDITAQANDIASYPGRFANGYFEALEPPDECDVSSLCGTPWTSNLASFLSVLKANSGGYPALGPSFASPLGPPLLGDVSAVSDIGNMHNYKGGWNPGFAGSWGYGYVNYLSDALSITLAGITNPNEPVISTETGYTNATVASNNQLGYPPGTWLPYDANSVDESKSAAYMPRVPLMAWLDGVQRTYIYELLSSPGQDYGLMRGDGSLKPAYLALASLVNNLTDPGPSFAVDPLAYSISGGDSTVKHLLLEKRNHTYYLILWVESPIVNKFTGQPISVASQTVTVSTRSKMTNATGMQWHSTGLVDVKSRTGSHLTVSVSPNIYMLVFTVQQ